MKKPNFILTSTAALAVVVLTSSIAAAQLVQQGGTTITPTGSVRLSKGEYKTVTLDQASGLTKTTTGTVSGTVSSLSVSAQALLATVSTTVTGTLDKKDIAKGRFGNKEILQLIFNTTDSKAFKGYSPVAVVPNDGNPGSGGVLAQAGGATFIGATDKAGTTVLVRPVTFNGTNLVIGVDGDSTLSFVDSVVAGKKNANERTATGFGSAGVSVYAPIADAFKKATVAGQTNVFVDAVGFGKFKQTYEQNSTGVITNSSKGTFSGK